MSRGLETLEKLKENKRKHWLENQPVEEWFDIIEKELKNFEWLKSKVSVDWFDKLNVEDKLKVLEIMGVDYD